MKYFVYYITIALGALCTDASAQTWIIEPKEGYGFNYPFTEGLGIVQEDATQTYGVIDTTGRQTMSFQFMDPPRFTEGQAVVQRVAKGSDELESYLLERNGRLIRLSESVDFSLGHNYFGRLVEAPYDMDTMEEPTFEIFKIAQPELLKSGNAIKELKLIPVFNERPLYFIAPFSHGYMLIEDVQDYFVTPDGKTAFTLNNSERSEPFDEYGFAQYMDADSVYLINTSFQKVCSQPRDAQREREFYYDIMGDGYTLFSSTFNDEWSCSIIHYEKPYKRYELGPQVDVFPLSKEGRYWTEVRMKEESEYNLFILKTVDGKELQRLHNYQFDSIHGTTAVFFNESEFIIVNFDGQITYRAEAESVFYGGEGYLWVTKDNKTGLLKFKI
jgi:hypothetical protein